MNVSPPARKILSFKSKHFRKLKEPIHRFYSLKQRKSLFVKEISENLIIIDSNYNNLTSREISNMETKKSLTIYVPYPEQFDFYWPESWASWLKYFERYLSLQDLMTLNDKKKIELLCYSMGPISDKILMRIHPEYENCSYEDVKQTLNNYFSPHCNICNGLENIKIHGENDAGELDEKFKIYRYTVKNLSMIMDNKPFHYSPEFQLHYLSCQLLIRKRICDRGQEFLSISLWSLKGNKSHLKDKVMGEIRLLRQNSCKPCFVVKINHVFHSANDFWESTHFMKWEEVSNPESGFIKDDSINLELKIESVISEK